MSDTRRPADPYLFLPEVPALTVTSSDIAQDVELPAAHRSGVMDAGGSDTSPQLAWSGAPPGTQSYAVTCFDPDAPTGSGFWHWVVYDLPATVTELPTGAGDLGGAHLPAGAKMLAGDAGLRQYVGAAPPVGHVQHRYFFVVHAVDVPSLGLPETATPAYLGFNLFTHTLARGRIIALFQR